MLFNQPPGAKANALPGYNAGPINKQTIGSLAVPGAQSQSITPGTNMQGTSSFSQPSSMPKAPSMTPYFNSGNGNLSTMLRVLLGKKQ